MTADTKGTAHTGKNFTIGISTFLLITLILAIIIFFYLPGRGVKGKIKIFYFWGASYVHELSSTVGKSSSQPLVPIRQAYAAGPLIIDPENPRYFADPDGNIVYLTGSHTWSNLQDNGGSYPPPVFDYGKFLDFLVSNNHNFFRLYTWEQSRWTSETTDENYWFFPGPPYQRTGPGIAIDGNPKFDLTKLDQSYFDRMRQRIIAAGDRGIYVSVMLFNGWSLAQGDPQWGAGKNNPWKGHPFNEDNNINSIDGDTNDDNDGSETHDLSIPSVTMIQDDYVKKVIDTVNDLDNVLYEICNECGADSNDWQYHIIDLIHSYEKTKPKQHPVGMTHLGNDPALQASPAEWISIQNNASLIPPVADGSRVSILDTDHICGVCGDRAWVWEAFTRGHNPIFMDGYDGAGYGVGGAGFVFNDPRWVSARANMGYTLTYTNRMNMVAMTPQPDLCSTGYCLAKASSPGAEYLVYLPEGGAINVDLSAASGQLLTEWFNPADGTVAGTGKVIGGAILSLTAPFSGDAVLYIYSSLPSDSSSTPSVTGTAPEIATLSTSTSTPIPSGTNPSGTFLYCVVGSLLAVVIIGVGFLVWKFRRSNRSG